jgi:hypothetical protein
MCFVQSYDSDTDPQYLVRLANRSLYNRIRMYLYGPQRGGDVPENEVANLRIL